MGHLVTVATCNLNQWALDFEGNRDRILESIVEAKKNGASFRTGPELEITGYGCLDHFLEADTYVHSWEMFVQIASNEQCQDIVLDIGMPVLHKSVRYNCRVIVFNKQIQLIRPKLWLANDGNYREMRYFTPWYRSKYVEEHRLPPIVTESLSGQRTVLFGDAKLDVFNTSFGFETCEELFTPNSPHIGLALDGVEIFTNSSGSHHELRKLDTRIKLIREATQKCGGVYLYANQRGCDGDRLYYDGCALIIVNGDVVAQASQFSLKDVEVITATVDLSAVRTHRSSPSFGMQTTAVDKSFPSVQCPEAEQVMAESRTQFDPSVVPTKIRDLKVYSPEEEIALGPACWLWDYLRRCRGGGFFIPLSGGIDSCATATLVYSMCRLVVKEAAEGNEQVIADARRIAGIAPDSDSDWIPTCPKEFNNILFHTCYMGTKNSSSETRARAKALASDIGAYHVDMNIDSAVSAVTTVFSTVTGKTPQFKVHGGTPRENLALQNIQARLRMVFSYLFALLLPWVRNSPSGGGLLVLGSANVDECLRGYLTKYDCSSADINPIGGISKTDLKRFIAYAQKEFDMPILGEFLTATPTAELEPITNTYVQSDEADMGFTYEELSVFGRLRKVDKCGPYSMFLKLYHEWTPRLSPSEIADKVKRFFYYYAINRHKQTILTPSYHAEQYSPDDNRYDLRPFLILPTFPWATKKIDKIVQDYEKAK